MYSHHSSHSIARSLIFACLNLFESRTSVEKIVTCILVEDQVLFYFIDLFLSFFDQSDRSRSTGTWSFL